MVKNDEGTLFSNLDRNAVLHKRKSRSESDDDLSDIDDAEINKYLKTNTEMRFKKLIWEIMNKDHSSKRNQIKPAAVKNCSKVKEVVASRTKKGREEGKENKKRLSSKINYAMLDKQRDEPSAWIPGPVASTWKHEREHICYGGPTGFKVEA